MSSKVRKILPFPAREIAIQDCGHSQRPRGKLVKVQGEFPRHLHDHFKEILVVWEDVSLNRPAERRAEHQFLGRAIRRNFGTV
jgi:hypothetical protein